MKSPAFDRTNHVYKNDAFAELVKDAVRFFNGTPVQSMQHLESFSGTGVYALYYTGSNPQYLKYAELNRLSYDFPIYVGKAVPKGWRQSRSSDGGQPKSKELCSRIKQHARNIALGDGLLVEDFSCRFVIFEAEGSDMISTIEAALIKLNRPLWNTAVDGFGNHDPGSGRYEQARSDWDVLHKGRAWAEKCKGKSKARATILANVERHLKALDK
jgi:Eco29kI restriction endonuclease